ncbi:MAG: cytochrome c3 family protein [Acidobacteria bacterium]|nr:cytochrome c3 family protein [Acidobacteriota bacterium]
MPLSDSPVFLLLPRWPMLAGFGLFSLLGSVFFLGHNSGVPVAQPIAFNHAKHISSGMGCTDCHTGAQSQARATLPALAACLACHESPLTESAEEQKIRTLAAAGKELEWIQLTPVPAHVYFSHRRHVELAKLECSACHGPMEKAVVPPQRPFRLLTMDACIECHQKSRAKTDCNDCHR